MKFKFRPPFILRTVFPDTIWESKNNKILLTFDDGPNPETTPVILESLGKNSIKALFFCVGENLKKFPELGKIILYQGHTIGNHTYSHTNLLTVGKRKAHNEILKFNNIMENNYGIFPRYFRPPYGLMRPGLQKELFNFNMVNIMWSLLTFDYENDINIVKFAIENYLTRNSIIVFHDNVKCGEIITESLNLTFRSVKEKGFEFGEPSECLN
ncbi:MAG: polysaccharide deacetylase family protein [Melioribacteraceae bacterium]|nr:polysaccharide deacetylase family protein [Melioribacteraceae bacterium]